MLFGNSNQSTKCETNSQELAIMKIKFAYLEKQFDIEKKKSKLLDFVIYLTLEIKLLLV